MVGSTTPENESLPTMSAPHPNLLPRGEGASGILFHGSLHQRTRYRTLSEQEESAMTILNVTEARSKLYNLIDETTSTHQPIFITGKRGNAVLLSEDDWNAISETLFLLSVPGMRESIKEGMNEAISECSKRLDW
jgi:prevent-host-death family protein